MLQPRENKSHLRDFFRQIPRMAVASGKRKGQTFVWGPRGEWRSEEIRELCEELGIVPGTGPFVHQSITKGSGYFRLQGRGGYHYRYTGLDLQQLLGATRQRKPCYVLFNNMAMLDDARRFLRFAGPNAAAGQIPLT